MIRLRILLIFILALCSFQFSVFAEEINSGIVCDPPELIQQPQILELLKNVKNEVLGTVPAFCKTNSPEQLNTDQGDKDLGQFVQSLINLELQKDDAFKFADYNTKKIQAIIFQSLKIISLKKMWQLSSEDNQYLTLMSLQCEPLGLNRYPIFKRAEIKNNSLHDGFDERIKMVKLCNAKEFSQIAPYLSKDVIAETLFNLKMSFPKLFNKMVPKLCDQLKNTDELIFKNDEYQSFYSNGKTFNNQAEFSEWLRSIFSGFDMEKHKEKLPFLPFDSLEYDNAESMKTALRFNYQVNSSKTIQDLNLNEEEIAALKGYTGSSFVQYNTCLRKNNCNAASLKVIAHMKSALKKLNSDSSNELKVYFRGARDLPKDILKALDKNEELVVDKGFISSSGEISVAKKFLGHDSSSRLFIIKSKSCAGIARISVNPPEDEFLCPPGLKFKSRKLPTMDDVHILEEVD